MMYWTSPGDGAPAAPAPGPLESGPRIEREIKFRIPEGRDAASVRDAIQGAGFDLRPAGAVAHEDRYVDTEDWLLHRAGLALRLRGSGSGVALEAKTVPAGEGALERTEWTQPAPEGDPPWTELPDGDVASLLRPLYPMGLLERLRVRARIRNDREVYRWSRGETALGSVTVDRVTDGDRAPYQELEVELADGALDALAAVRQAVVERLGIAPNPETKLAAALHAAGQGPPERDERPFALHRADRLVDIAHKTLGRHLSRLFWNEPGTRLGIDPESLHDMRVASRRLRTALQVFADAVPEGTRDRFASELRWIGRALGRVRDLDVHIACVDALREGAEELERPALDIFRRGLELRRARRRLRLLERLNSERYAAFAAEARAWAAGDLPAPKPGAAGGAPGYTVGPRLVADRMRAMQEAFEEAVADPAPAALHALRIAVKKARYALEYFAELEGPRAQRRARRLARLQDFLGERQDAATLLRRMRKYAKTIPHRDRELTLGAGSVLGVLERSAKTKRGELRRAWEEAQQAE